MRLLGTTAAIVAALAASVVGASAPQRAPLDVRTVIADPRFYTGRAIAISGVLEAGPYSRLLHDAEAMAHRQKAAGIQVVSYERIVTQHEKYFGAVVTITGRYTNDCPGGDFRCAGLGGNGRLEADEIAIRGYVDTAHLGRDRSKQDERYAMLDPADGRVAEVGLLARAMHAAAQQGDRHSLANLFVSRARDDVFANLADRDSRVWWEFMASEMRSTAPESPGKSYVVLSAGFFGWRTFELCLCRTSNCEGRWPSFKSDILWPNIRDPYLCHTIVLENDRWKLGW